MEARKRKGLKWRGVTTFLLILTLLVDILSGIILYITPSGRVARWTNWSVLGLDKWEWQNIHTIFSFFLILIVIFHLYYNWRVVVHFLWNKINSAMNLKWELGLATVIVAFLIMGTLWSLQPFRTLTDFGESISRSWEKRSLLSQRSGPGERHTKLLDGRERYLGRRGRGNYGIPASKGLLLD